MHTALVIEDSELCRTVVSKTLEKCSMTVTAATTFAEASRRVESGSYDLVFLDLVLPDGDGLNLLSALENNPANRDAQVFILSTKEDLATKVLAFNLGVDDYLVKPVNPVELKARVEMRLRKIDAKRRENEKIRLGRLTIHLPQMMVFRSENGSDECLPLTTKEFKILSYLALNRGRIFSRADLMKAIWGESTHVIERTIDSHICALRRKLGDDAFHIDCVSGAGYRALECE